MLSRLAHNVRQLRKSKKMTQFELAERAGVSEMTVKKIETARQWVSEGTLVQLACALETDVCTFFLPVEGDFVLSDQTKERVRCVLREGFAHFVEDSLKEITSALSIN